MTKEKISVIIPFHNEKESLPLLLPALEKELAKLTERFEIILVDDGSTDGYDKAELKKFSSVKLINQGKQRGKGVALRQGINKASGDLYVFMDADLQDDPADLSNFLTKLEEGFDLVNGHRHKRKDNPIVKFYSGIARYMLQHFYASPFTDINCGFKMFRKEILDDVVLYGNNFRFLPLAAYHQGYQVTEIPVHNHQRQYGKSKFGTKKLFIGMIDMLSAYFIYRFAEQPLHFFGIIGGAFTMLGGLVIAILTYQRLFEGILLYNRPALQYAILVFILGVQIIMTGILGELVVYLHHKQK
ncbi:MAG: glycosyltransferase family 2 protein [Weeksellaceae bacterium]